MRTAILLLIVTASVDACGGGQRSDRPAEEVSIPFHRDGDMTLFHEGDPVVEVAIEIADTDSSRNRGLMQRTTMPDRSAMLFVFPNEQIQRFWMANTLISLDFLFLDADGRIVSTSRAARPLSVDPVESGVPAQYVVEFEAGFLDTWGIVEGDSAAWHRDESP